MPQEELPIWFIEYLYDKSIENIYEDFEKMNKEEVNQIRRKLRKNINGGNNGHNKGSGYKNGGFLDDYQQRTNGIYNNVKNNILRVLERKARYFFIRSSSVDKIKVSKHSKFIFFTFNSNQLK